MSVINTLEDLRVFTQNRPQLKKKIDEALEAFGIENYSKVDPVIKELKFSGGNAHYDDDGKNTSHFDIDLQIIEIEATLQDDSSVYAKITQKKRNFKIQTRVIFQSGGAFGRRGKKHFLKIMDDARKIINSGINPYQQELEARMASFEHTKKSYDEVKAEYIIISKNKENLPLAYKYISKELSLADDRMQEAKRFLELTEKKYQSFS